MYMSKLFLECLNISSNLKALKIYYIENKLAVLRFSEQYSNMKAAFCYNIIPKSIRYYKKFTDNPTKKKRRFKITILSSRSYSQLCKE